MRRRREPFPFYRSTRGAASGVAAGDAPVTLGHNPASCRVPSETPMLRSGFLPSTLPGDPMPVVHEWFSDARARQAQPNPDAMVVATSTPDGRPSARVVLCKHLVADPGYVVFFTNYDSRKGAELAANPRAAAVFHWDALGRQVRLEGPILKSPEHESADYFATRALDSRIGAWASLQSQPLDSRTTLLKRVAVEAARHGTQVPKPPHWGGYRLWPDTVELWIEGSFRVHDRARWNRTLAPSGPHEFAPGAWQSTRLYP
jgi:pyridoxamine 5'-phosphate oxidase